MNVYGSLIYKAKKWKQPKCPFINESINKIRASMQWNILPTIKMRVLIHTTVWVYLGKHYTKGKKSATEGHICMIHLDMKCLE